MYFAHFGLKRPPFENAGGNAAFYAGDGHGEALEFFREAFASPHLLVALTGPGGVGKVRTLETFLSGWTGPVTGGWLDALPATSEEFLEAVLALAGFQPVEAQAPELRSILTVFLGHQAQKGSQVALIVRLAGSVAPAVVEELAWMGTLDAVRQGRVKLVLIGDERLERALDAPRNRGLRKLLNHHHQLAPLSAEGTQDYLEFRLEVAGSPRPHEPFTRGAVEKIHALSGGFPAAINALAEASLGRAWKAGTARVGPALVTADPLPVASEAGAGGDYRAEPKAPATSLDGADSPVLSFRMDGAPSVRHELEGDRILVGRHEWNDLRLDHGSVSRHHALLVRVEDRWMIVDLNSTNGIRVNGRRIKVAGLASGDRVEIGEFSGAIRNVPAVSSREETWEGTLALGG